MAGRLFYVTWIAAMLLGGCVLPEPKPAEPLFDPGAFRTALYALPGAQVAEGEGMTVKYPGETLFAPMSVLPLPGGTALLDPLAALIIKYPGVGWKGIVRAETDVSEEYDLSLAQKRREILGKIFANRGVPESLLPLTALEGEGPPFELTVHPDESTAPLTSSAEKR